MQVRRPFSVVWRAAGAPFRRIRSPWSTASRLPSRPEFPRVNALVGQVPVYTEILIH